MFEQKSFFFRRRLRHCGKGVKIFRRAEIIRPEVIRVGDYSEIDDFTVLFGGESIEIGRRVHIAPFVSVLGGGRFIAEDYAGVAAGCRIMTGTDDFLGLAMTNPCVPMKYRSVTRSCVRLKKHAILGTGAIVHPGVTIGEGAVVGSGSQVVRDVEPWTVNVGSPCRAIKTRPSGTILRMEKELEREPLPCGAR